MHKRQLLYFREPEVRTILERHLAKEGYSVYPKVRLQDAIGLDRSERLPAREFDFLTRAHLDFVVALREMPVFAVEFDGIDHRHDPKTIERDAIKNSLCKLANLPLLRITSTEIEEYDRLTLLDYMLMRYVAWQKEHDDLMHEMAEYAAAVGPEADPEDLAIDLDPAFQFGLKHPFPGFAIVRERLLRNFGICWMAPPRSDQYRIKYICDLLPGASGVVEHDQFHTCQIRARVWHVADPQQTPIFADQVAVTIRSWLPLSPDVPAPEFDFWSNFDIKALEAWRIRIERMWFPHLPGIETTSVAENYAEYLGLRSIERWAKTTLSARDR